MLLSKDKRETRLGHSLEGLNTEKKNSYTDYKEISAILVKVWLLFEML